MKFISWNVNGIRACIGKGLLDFIKDENADFVCIQETKARKEQVNLELAGYKQYWSSAERKGYSGTLILAKSEALSVEYKNDMDNEGRTVCLEYEDFYLVNNYVPNAQDGLARIDFRLRWEEERREFLRSLDKKKPVILCGDLNVAHNEIDLTYPDANRGNAGFSDEEREAFNQLLDCGFVDGFRFLYPDKVEYTWWSYRTRARERNIGWRIDYFVLSDRIKDKIKDVTIRGDIYGSDHCPIILNLA